MNKPRYYSFIKYLTFQAKRYCSTLSKELLIDIKPVLQEWNSKLKKAGVGDRDFNLQCLVKRALKQSISTSINLDTIKFTQEQYKTFQQLCEQRCARVPLQHIMGEWMFMGLTLKTKPNVFIPRPDTEEFVNKVIEVYKNITKPINMLEVGCGSGAISLAILSNIGLISSTAFDCCKESVELAKENASGLQLQRRFQAFCHTMEDNDYLPKELKDCKFDLIVGNPPFAKPEDISMLSPEVLLYENHKALDGGPDGLRVARLVLKLSCIYLRNGGKLWLELGSDQPPLMKTIINLQYKQHLSFVNSYKDSLKRERFVEIIKI